MNIDISKTKGQLNKKFFKTERYCTCNKPEPKDNSSKCNICGKDIDYKKLKKISEGCYIPPKNGNQLF